MSLDFNPQTVSQAIISVPHSGTRSLQDVWHILHGQVEWDWIDGKPVVTRQPAIAERAIGHWHWSLHNKYIEEFLLLGDKVAYVPVRDPLAVADSWDRRYLGDAPEKSWETLIQCLQAQVQAENNPSRVEYCVTEMNPIHRGKGPQPGGTTGIRVRAVTDWLHRDHEARAFYERWYTPDWAEGRFIPREDSWQTSSLFVQSATVLRNAPSSKSQ